MTEWDWITVGAAAVGLVAATVFLGRYLYEAGLDAWRNPFGRFLLTRKALLAVLFATVLMNRIELPWWLEVGKEPVTALLISAFALQTFWPYRLLLKAQEEAQLSKEEASRS